MFTEGLRRHDLYESRMLALSLVKCIEIIGEAAARIGPRTQNELTHIPWADIVGMRKRLIHGYYEVDLDRVWDTIEHDLPPLIEALEQALGPPDQDA